MQSSPVSQETAASTINRVDSHVYIGGYLAAADPWLVRRLGITRIVKMFADDPSPGGAHRHEGVAYFIVPADDSPDYDIRQGAFGAVRFIREGLARCEKTLVQCHMGISRSATVVLFHLMINRGMPLSLAEARLRLVRPFVQPNPGFMQHLRATDARLRRLRTGDEQAYVAPPPVLGVEAASPAAELWGYAPALAEAPPRAAHAPPYRGAESLDSALLRRLARDDRGHAGGRDGATDFDLSLPSEPAWSFSDHAYDTAAHAYDSAAI